MSTQVQNILTLTEHLATHQGVTHWALSYRLDKRGDTLKRLQDGSDILSGRAERLVKKIDEMWPDDLEWPPDIPRPSDAEDVSNVA